MSQIDDIAGHWGVELLVSKTHETWAFLGAVKDGFFDLYRNETFAQIGLFIIVTVVLVGVFAPLLAPFDPNGMARGPDGSVVRMAEPSSQHWLGTTNLGRDIASQMIMGARISLIVGSAAAFIALTVGTLVGLISAYYGGWIDDILMRITDITYSLPFLPLAISLVFLLGTGLENIILIIGLVYWRQPARVIRSEALSIKERPYIESAKSSGASDVRVIFYHLLPNLLPIIALYGAILVAYAIILESSLSFLGFGDPTTYSWGRIIYDAYSSGSIRHAWWWVLPPGFAIMLTVMAVFFIGRALEKITNPEIEQ